MNQAMHQGQLQTLHNYIHDNPKRLGIKRMKPDLFRIRQTCASANRNTPLWATFSS